MEGRASSQSRSARKEPMLSAAAEGGATFDDEAWFPVAVAPTWPPLGGGGGNLGSTMMEGIFCIGGTQVS